MKARYILTQEIIGTYGTMSVPGSAVATHRAVCPNPHVTALPGCAGQYLRRRDYLISALSAATARLPAWLGRGGSDHTGTNQKLRARNKIAPIKSESQSCLNSVRVQVLLVF